MQNMKTNDGIAHTRIEAILETAVDAIVTINRDGIIGMFNLAAEKMFGYSAEEAIGKSVNMLMPEPYSSEHESYIKNYETTKVKKIIGIGREAVGKRKNGSIFPIFLSVGEAVINDKPIYVGFIHDISKRKQQEIELKNHRDHLQLLVDIRTEELSLANEKLQKLANLDGLTNLANRRNFDEILQKEIQRAVRHKHPLSLMMCDIDYFKQFNDNYGHLAGDDCLIKIAECLKSSFKRAADLPARYGGEEFAVILPHTNHKEAKQMSERFFDSIKYLKIPHCESDVSDYVTISIGMVTVVPDKTTDVNSLINTADEELYKAKQNGRNRIELANLE